MIGLHTSLGGAAVRWCERKFGDDERAAADLPLLRTDAWARSNGAPGAERRSRQVYVRGSNVRRRCSAVEGLGRLRLHRVQGQGLVLAVWRLWEASDQA